MTEKSNSTLRKCNSEIFNEESDSCTDHCSFGKAIEKLLAATSGLK